MKHTSSYLFIVSFFLLLSHSFYIHVKETEESNSDVVNFENIDQQDSHDLKDTEEYLDLEEKLKDEILEIFTTSYKDIIDLSALYFCGLVDYNKLYYQITALLHKDFFKILKLFSWYIPAILKNKNIPMCVKIKKSVYVASCIIAFWYISKEVFQDKSDSQCKIVTKGLIFDHDEISFGPRQKRLSLDL